MARKIWIGSDHAGFELKTDIVVYLKARGFDVIDCGTHSMDSVHYPMNAFEVAKQIIQNTSEEERLNPCGVLICGSGVGVSIGANRVKGIRAVLALREDVAQLSREHNASNVLCLGARLMSLDEARRVIDTWLKADFEGGRHALRVGLLDEPPNI